MIGGWKLVRRRTAIRTGAGSGRPSWSVVVVASGCSGVFTHAGSSERTAWYSDQAGLTPQLVGGGTFGKMFESAVDGQVYAQPVISKDTALVATEKNNVYGIDAITGARKWSRNVGAPWNPNDVGCADLVPWVGITSTPVIDPATNTAYFFKKTYASGTSGPAGVVRPRGRCRTGAERAGFPVRIQGTAANDPGKAFNATNAIQRAGLLLLNGVVYAAFAGHCDHQPYSGWVVGVSTAGTLRTMWTSAPGDTGAAGIWQSGGGLIVDGPDSIVLATGNGSPERDRAAGQRAGREAGPGRRATEGAGRTDRCGPSTSSARTTPTRSTRGMPTSRPVARCSCRRPVQHAGASPAGRDHGEAGVPLPAGSGGSRGDEAGAQRRRPRRPRFGPFGGVWGQVAAWPGDGGYLYLLPPTSFVGDGVVRVLKWGIDGAGKPSLAEVGRTNESGRVRVHRVGRLVGRYEVGHRGCCGCSPATQAATASCACTTRPGERQARAAVERLAREVDQVLGPGGLRQARRHGHGGRPAAVVRIAGDAAAQRWTVRRPGDARSARPRRRA